MKKSASKKQKSAGVWQVGKAYFIRTVTHHLVGELVMVTEQELVLTKAAWIGHDGRFNEAVRTGEYDEVEPFPADAEVIVGRGALIDATLHNGKLPLAVK